jgi:hypothetical protein
MESLSVEVDMDDESWSEDDVSGKFVWQYREWILIWNTAVNAETIKYQWKKIK